jgi:hypothetical protein
LCGVSANWRRPREQQPVDVGTRERLAGLAAAVDDRQRARRQPRRIPARRHEIGDRRGQLGRLEHDGVAREQGWNDVAVRQMRGEIVRAEDRQHPVRAVAEHLTDSRDLAGARSRALGLRDDRDVDLGTDARDLGPGFPQRLAGLARDQHREILGALPDDVGESPGDGDPCIERGRAPARKSGARIGHRRDGIAGSTLPHDLVGARIGGGQDHRLKPHMPNLVAHFEPHQFSLAPR